MVTVIRGDMDGFETDGSAIHHRLHKRAEQMDSKRFLVIDLRIKRAAVAHGDEVQTRDHEDNLMTCA